MYEEILNTNQKFYGSKGIVYIGEKIIVIKRDNKTDIYPLMFDLVGGGREEGESPFETFAREVQEEIGLQVDINDICYFKKHPRPSDLDQVSYFMVAKPKNLTEEDIVFGNEGLYFKLMTLEEFVYLPDAIPSQQMKAKEYLTLN